MVIRAFNKIKRKKNKMNNLKKMEISMSSIKISMKTRRDQINLSIKKRS